MVTAPLIAGIFRGCTRVFDMYELSFYWNCRWKAVAIAEV
jgi:hypothetical protein